MTADDDIIARLRAAMSILPATDEVTPERIEQLADGLASRMGQVAQQIVEGQGGRPVRGTDTGFIVSMLAALAQQVTEHGPRWLTEGIPATGDRGLRRHSRAQALRLVRDGRQ